MPRRTALPALGAAVAAVLLAGCSAAPTGSERDAWQKWADDAVAASGFPGLGGGAGSADSPATKSVTLPDETPVTSVELACTGTDLMDFTLAYTDGTEKGTGSHDLVCGGDYATIVLPAGFTGLTAVTVTVSSADARGAWAVVLRNDP